MPVDGDIAGIGGTGGTRRSGEPGPERLVTPGIYAIWMMFEARVRTDEAIEATVWVDARVLRLETKSFSGFSSRYSGSCHSVGSIFLRRPLKQNFHTMKVRIATKATPPITPPAMAPTFGPESLS